MKTKLQRINKRIMAMIISFAIVIGVIAAPQMDIPTYAIQESDFETDNFSFKILDDGVSVRVARGPYYLKNVKIPSKVDYNGKTYNVTEIGARCFFEDDAIISVAIPNSVTIIREEAFANAWNLEKVSIPDSVTTIEGQAFSDCILLSSITIPDSVTKIGNGAFRSCYSLTSITIPDSVVEIGNGAFSECYNLESAVLSNSIKIIPDNLFYYTNLKNITIPDSVSDIGMHAFSECNCLNSVIVPSNVETISSTAFDYCDILESISIPYNVKFYDGSPHFSYSKYCSFIVNSDHGKVNISATNTPKKLLDRNGLLIDDTVSVNVVPDAGYKVSSIEVLDDKDNAVDLSSDNKFFTNESNYTINVTFEALDSGQSGTVSSGSGTAGGNIGSSGNSSNNGTGNAAGTSSGTSSNTGSGSAAAGNSSNGVAYSSEWVNGKWYNADGSQTYEPTMSWKSNSVGWWLEDTSGWYPVSQWQKVDGYWYYFNTDGYMASIEWRDGYYLSGSGALTYDPTGSWYKDSNGWYFMDTSGWYPVSQWQKINGSWYYFDGSGYMVTSRYIDGYWVGSDGVCN